MTTSSLRVAYPSLADRFVARLGRALVRWADARAVRAATTHERQSRVLVSERALRERERAALTTSQLRG